MVAADFSAFVDILHANLPDNILRVTVLNSVKGLLKKQLTAELLYDTCWRLAGNLERLLDQEPVPVWSRQTKFEWVPAEICEVATVKRCNRLENQIVFRSVAGSIVPRKLVQWWSFRKTNYLTTYRDEKGNGFGFGRHRMNRRGEQLGRLLFYDIRQFYGLQCLLLLDPTRSGVDPAAVEIGHTGSMCQHNRRMLGMRDRVESPCLKGFSEQQECFNCPYGEDRCTLATHPLTYQVGGCSRCGTSRTFFDPAEQDHLNICVNCVFEERRA
jgi:hypothetical protein